MYLRSQMAKSILFAGIPLLTLPLLAESGMSRDDRSQRQDRERSNATHQLIQGEISKKNGEEITLRTSDGERITFRINDQTNQLCPKGTQTSQTSSMGKGSSSKGQGSSAKSSSGQSSSGQNQMAQGSSGQESADVGQTSSSSLFGSSSGQGSGQTSSGKQSSSQQAGFKFGECNFHKGETVKARVDENGDAIFVRSMGSQNDENYFDAGREGDNYFVLPAGQMGGLDISDKDSHYSVKSSDGEEIGEVHRIITSGNGDLSYAIIKKNDGQLISVPWQALEGAGNKSFKLNVNQDQLGNLPILEKGENTVQHVQKHWDLTGDEQQRLAKWNDRLDERNQVRDRYYEDTPTFPNNREGYDRYDYDQSRQSGMSRSGDDQGRSFDRNRQGRSSNDYRNRGNQQYSRSQDREYDNYGDRSESRSNLGNYDDSQNSGGQRSMYSQGRERNYRDPVENLSDQYNTTTPRSQYDPQRQGADQYQSRRSGGKDYDYRPDGYRP